MDDEDGEEPDSSLSNNSDISIDSNRIYSRLTPISRKTYTDIMGESVENSPPLSPTNVALLSRELESIRTKFYDDEKLMIETVNLSQRITNLLKKNKKDQIPKQNTDLTSKPRMNLNLKYPITSTGPYIIIVEQNQVIT